MKRRIYVLWGWVCLSVLSTLSISAQPVAQPMKQAQLTFEDISVAQVGSGYLEVTFRLQVTGRVVGLGEALQVIPYYEVADQRVAFPMILINDPVRHGYYKRERVLGRERSGEGGSAPLHTLVLRGRHTDDTILYRGLIALPEGMSREGRVVIYQYLQDCCTSTQVDAYDVGKVGADMQDLSVASVPSLVPLAPPVVTPDCVPFFEPAIETDKQRQESHTIHIQFPIGKWDILPSFAQNTSELEQVDRVMHPLLRGDGVELLSGVITGYASPESSAQFNLVLSQKRADSFRSYLQSKYVLQDQNSFSSYGKGEDWQGLRRAIVEATSLEGRDALLALMDEVQDLDEREGRMKSVAGGVAYQFLQEQIYPQLRRIVLELKYKVRPYTLAEAEQLLSTRPQELSQQEMYQVIQHRYADQKGGKSYGIEYDIAVQYFGEDPIAYLNASSAALVRGDYDRAWHYLQRVQQDARAYNNLALYYWAMGDAEHAQSYLRDALKVPEIAMIATRNMESLRHALREVASKGLEVVEK